jgi:hypothetical protein
MHKIRLSDPPPTTATTISLNAARNEFESYQIVIRGPATNVTATASAMVGPNGAQLLPAQCSVPGHIRLYREDLYSVDVDPNTTTPPPSDVDAMVGAIPDALIPQVDEFDNICRSFTFSVAPNTTRVLWVDVFVPQNATPGTYSGTIRINASEGSRTISANLNVWDFALPPTSSMRSYVPYSFNAITSQHGFASCTPPLQSLLTRYATLALDHRWTLAFYDDGCANQADPSHIVATYGPLLNGTAQTRLQGAQATSIAFQANVDDDADVSGWASFSPAPSGWLERLILYVADEPQFIEDWNIVRPRALSAHGAGHPYLKTLVTQSIEAATNAIRDGAVLGLEDINIFTPLANQVEPFGQSSTRGAYDAWLASDPRNELWQYQSCVTHGCGGDLPIESPPPPATRPRWPSLMIDHSLIRARALEWLSFKHNIRGELYFAATAAFRTGNDPRTNQFFDGGNGDGTLFYPGAPGLYLGAAGTDFPIASMRMKMIREGMEDYEYMRVLESPPMNERPFVLSQIAGVFSAASNTDADPAALYTARQNMACRILTRLGRPCTGGGSCVPQTCSGRCGSIPDGCGGTLSCGGCSGAGLKCFDPDAGGYFYSGMTCSNTVCEARPCP